MRNRIVVYPDQSSAISSVTIYPSDRLIGIEYTSSCKVYTYVLKDLSVIGSIAETQAYGESLGKCINRAIKAGRITK